MVSILTGLSTAAILFIVSAGLSLVFGTMRIINMAHGTFYMIGAYLVTLAFAGLTMRATGFVIALILAAVLVSVLGIVIEMFVLRRLYQSEHLFQLLATWGLMLVLEEVSLIVWGPNNVTGSIPGGLSGSFAIGGQSFPFYNAFLIGAALVIAALLWLLLKFTPLGRIIRAAVQDAELIYTLGVNVKRLYTQVFALGTFLAALGGALVAPSTSLGPGMDAQIVMEAFIVSVIGGLGSIWGTALGALVIGLFQSLGNLIAPEVAALAPYLVMILVLIIRPTGIFGKAEA